MKIAVPSNGNRVDEHFGHCEYFTVFSVNDKKEIVSEEKVKPAGDHARRFRRVCQPNSPPAALDFCGGLFLAMCRMPLSGDQSQDHTKRGDEHQQRL